MPEQPEHVEATFYATIEPVWAEWAKDGRGRKILRAAKVTSVTQNRPERRTRTGTVVTRLTLRIPASAMLPLEPDVVIHLRPDDLETIQVEADDPGYPESEEQQA